MKDLLALAANFEILRCAQDDTERAQNDKADNASLHRSVITKTIRK